MNFTRKNCIILEVFIIILIHNNIATLEEEQDLGKKKSKDSV